MTGGAGTGTAGRGTVLVAGTPVADLFAACSLLVEGTDVVPGGGEKMAVGRRHQGAPGGARRGRKINVLGMRLHRSSFWLRCAATVGSRGLDRRAARARPTHKYGGVPRLMACDSSHV